MGTYKPHGCSTHPTPEYRSWCAMRVRCNNPNVRDYPRYGGRGISVCKRWDSFNTFLADMGPRPAGTTLDRIDCEGHYEPNNCRWATALEQTQNRRKIAKPKRWCYCGREHYATGVCKMHYQQEYRRR